ncbi:MAG TPA: hypothetical protein VE526_01185 [Solirubrobacteraceae bacterium]|nr:hypothetical protein [Solirubrobacteraceae bacterium]
MAQYHEQIRLDPSRESAVYRDADGKYHVMQGKTTRVGFPPETDARPPLQLIYHSHPTQNTPREQGFVSQPSQAGGDFGVVQYQHGRTAPVGQRQSSELHFPVYNRAGEHVGYGTTTFHYDPTHPLPLQVETTLPGGRPTRQRYRSFEDFQRRAGVGPGGQTPEERAAASTQAREQLRADQEAGGRRVEEVAKQLPRPPTHRGSARAGAEAGGREPEPGAAGRPRLGPAYTARAAGLRPGESIDVPINPHYEPPPGTPAEIAALRERIAESRRVQASLAQTERAMGAQAAQQRAHDTQLQGAQTVATQLGTGRSAHQTAANTTSTANTQQRTAAQSTIDTLGQTSREYSGVATLVGSLRVFQGLAHLFGYLPGSLGSSAQRARGDAARLIASVERVRNADATRGQMQANSGSLAADATRIQQVQTRGAATDSEIARGGQGVEALRASNRERLAETTATRAQASDERETAADHQQEAQTKHDDLNVRMREWAQAHRAERSRAVEEASARLAAQGYRTRAEGT